MSEGVPTVYFIDDSATMREVIKIAFRRENINVVACSDANSALHQIEEHSPDVVISDLIMPEKDGYEVCQYIKQHPRLGATPVILMSGVVNRAVAEKAFAVKADELIRKPFQPQDLITRVKHLLKQPASPPAPAPQPASPAATAALSSIFSASSKTVARPLVAPQAMAQQAAPAPQPMTVASPAPVAPVRAPAPPSGGSDVGKLRLEMMRLENLVKKLQAELDAEREYARALEAHIKTLQENE